MSLPQPLFPELIFLVGMPGSGKSYWLNQLAHQLDYQAIDMDQFIEQESGAAIPELFARGVAHFRYWERHALLSLLAEKKTGTVVATGGGLPCHEDNIDLIKAAGCVLYLRGTPAFLCRNIGSSTVERPLFKGLSGPALKAALIQMYQERKPYYEQAHIIIEATRATLTTFTTALNQFFHSVR